MLNEIINVEPSLTIDEDSPILYLITNKYKKILNDYFYMKKLPLFEEICETSFRKNKKIYTFIRLTEYLYDYAVIFDIKEFENYIKKYCDHQIGQYNDKNLYIIYDYIDDDIVDEYIKNDFSKFYELPKEFLSDKIKKKYSHLGSDYGFFNAIDK
jgi:hypothetical protein